MATNTEKLDNIATNVTELKTDFAIVKKQSSDMYKLLVSGNGIKPLLEIVRNHEDWICEKKEEEKSKETARREFSWKVALEIAKQLIYPVGIAFALWLGLK